MTSIYKGRWWCGNVCPRGNMYDRLLDKAPYVTAVGKRKQG